jgi:DNA-binding CsgD family transcriptional regulator
LDVEKMGLDQRNEEIWKLRKEGATFREIASRFDMSRSRAR